MYISLCSWAKWMTLTPEATMLSIGGATPSAACGRGRGGAKEAALAALAKPGEALERGRAAEDHDESDN
jgi:hypothetical protein